MSGDPGTERAVRLRCWWDALTADERAHARRCVLDGVGDARLARSLMTAGIALVVRRASSSSDSVMLIPRDLETFVGTTLE